MRGILALPEDGLQQTLQGFGQPKFRAAQLWQWLHQKLATDFDQMRNLPADLREKLQAEFAIRVLAPREHLCSADGLTEKWLLESTSPAESAPAHPCHVETVLIREIRDKRRTVCVSCMSGCPIGCTFCATGQHGFERNLDRGEILEQIYLAQHRCLEEGGAGLSNIVFMGMGEPLLNYDNVIGAARTISSPGGLNLGGRHITISTVGIPAGIRRMVEDGLNFRLALSLHAPTQNLRESLIPAAKKWPLRDLLPALREFATSSSRQVTIEYCLIDRVNDRKAQARELVELLRGIPCKINLIPLNPTEGFAHGAPPPEKIRAFQSTLESHGLGTTLREEKGRDINAACGQLRAQATKGQQ